MTLASIGCENTLTKSSVDAKTALEETFSYDPVPSEGDQFSLRSSGHSSDFSDLRNARITLVFSLHIDPESLADGIVIREMLNSEDNNTPYKVGRVFTPKHITADNSGDYGKLNITLDVSDNVGRIEIWFKANRFRAVNGQKLDTDWDYIQGESPEDDLYRYYDVNYALRPTKGCKRNPQKAIRFRPYENPYEGGQYHGTNSSMHFIRSSATVAGSDIFRIRVDTDSNTDTVVGIMTHDLKDVLDAYLSIQAYSYSAQKWVELPKKASSFDPDEYGVKRYECTFDPQPDGTPLRAYIENRYTIATSEPIQGFIRRLSYDQLGNRAGFASPSYAGGGGEWVLYALSQGPESERTRLDPGLNSSGFSGYWPWTTWWPALPSKSFLSRT